MQKRLTNNHYIQSDTDEKTLIPQKTDGLDFGNITNGKWLIGV